MPPTEPNGHKKGLWNGTPKWVQWSTYAGVLAAIVLVGSAVKAVDTLEPFLPVTWGSLENWERVAQLEKQLVKQVDIIRWDQVIYRTRDLEFQIDQLKNTELMLLSVLSENPGFNELNNLRRDRLEEVQTSIAEKTEELKTLNCQIVNRENPSRC